MPSTTINLTHAIIREKKVFSKYNRKSTWRYILKKGLEKIKDETEREALCSPESK